MRQWILFLLLLSSSALYADNFYSGDYDCTYLKVTIKNNTPEVCTLIEKKVNHGRISILMPFPYSILSGMEGMLLVEEGAFYGSNIVLTYECGQDRFISFKSQKNHSTVFSGGAMTADILVSSKMDATYDVSTYQEDKQPGSIYWTLY